MRGGYVPWFGTQLVNGNSLIGARRQVYHRNQLVATSKGLRWFEAAPERIPFVKLDAMGRNIARSRYQVYHFLTGDPGMCDYTDKVIKSLEPENMKRMKAWNKQFTAPYSEDEVKSLTELSKLIDVLWRDQIKARKDLEAATITSLDVFGHRDTRFEMHRTIREKDRFLRGIYKSEHAKNAGAYARLKFAMDYWCALWFWPIQKAELLPSRAEYINDMDLILRGVMHTGGNQNSQTNLFGAEEEEIPDIQDVDLEQLCTLIPRLALVKEIADQNHFLHWELEFADLFAERGGFDLILGNPPWIKIKWEENGVLSEQAPTFAVHNLTAKQSADNRDKVLKSINARKEYFAECISFLGMQSYFSAFTNYNELKGQQTNLFKCFLPQAWHFGADEGISAFIHPEGVYDDPNGDYLRTMLYPKLRKHFQFRNELKLFSEVHHSRIYSINIYSNKETGTFETISNLFVPSAVDECYEENYRTTISLGLKDENGDWNCCGCPERVLKVSNKELQAFARVYDGDKSAWRGARLPVLQIDAFMRVVSLVAKQEHTFANLGSELFGTRMWDETNAQKDGTIKRLVDFPESLSSFIYSGPHFGVATPLLKTPRRICRLNSDYDSVDLEVIGNTYIQRSNYTPSCDSKVYYGRIPQTPWGTKCNDEYRLATRAMVDPVGRRSLISAIVPPKCGHINSVFMMNFKNPENLLLAAATFSSLPIDFIIKTTGKSAFLTDGAIKLPLFDKKAYLPALTRIALLNCVTRYYADLWKSVYCEEFRNTEWAKKDSRLSEETFSTLTEMWTPKTPLRSDYSRREALIEIDVLTAMSLGMSLKQLLLIYKVQFSILQAHEADTWYDANGRIAFTIDRSLNGVGFSRNEWEGSNMITPIRRGHEEWDGIVKNAPAGYVFSRTITDDTMPGGPVERTIEYVAPFDRCDREQDYETAWKFFEEKYGGNA